MTSAECVALANALLPVVLAAARIQLGYFESGVAVQTKADTTPVTLADQESEAVILAGLAAIAPGIPVVAEEAMAAGTMPAIGERFFLVDPLDGTREFIAGRPEFTVNIALVERGVPVFGLVYAPAAGRLFVTLGPEQAIEALIAATSAVQRIDDLQPTTIRARQPDPAALVAVASRSHMTAATEAYLARFHIADRRQAGSSMKFCLIARGDADLYPRIGGKTCEWDIAAGHAVLAAAGGRVVQPDGSPMPYGRSAARFVNGDYVAWGREVVAG